MASLEGLAEIVVVDSGSTDGTLAIVEGFSRQGLPIRLIRQSWLGYAAQKQFALDQASEPWVLSVDADEWLDGEMRKSLPELIAAGAVRRRLEAAAHANPLPARRCGSPCGRGRN